MRFNRFVALYRHRLRDPRRERMMLASASFFIAFAAVRLAVNGFRARQQPFEMWIGGVHLHHYVWGIALLLLVGYLWLIQIGTSAAEESRRLGRLTAVLYGIGAALTLDEFALWLRLDDVYWERAGRASIDAVFLFGALVSVGIWGGPFWRAAGRQLARLLRRGAHLPPPAAEPAVEGAVARLEEILLPSALVVPPVEAPARSGATHPSG